MKIIAKSHTVDSREHMTTFTAFADGSAEITEHGPCPRGSGPVRPLLYARSIAPDTEEAEMVIAAAKLGGVTVID